MNIMILKIGILLAIMAPTVLLLIAGAAGRICRLVFGHVPAEQGSRMSRGNQLRRPGVSPRTPHLCGGGPGRGSTDDERSADPDEKPLTFASYFESGQRLDPAELLGAAHVGCFIMNLAVSLRAAGYAATELSAEAVLTVYPAIASAARR